MNKDEVLKLSKLARIEISDTEAEKLSHEFEAILNYVSQVKGITSPQPLSLPRRGVDSDGNRSGGEVYNIMREDTNPRESGLYKEKLLEQAPNHDKNYVKVKNIFE